MQSLLYRKKRRLRAFIAPYTRKIIKIQNNYTPKEW